MLQVYDEIDKEKYPAWRTKLEVLNNRLQRSRLGVSLLSRCHRKSR